MIIAANVFESLWVIVTNIAKGFANVAFTSSLIVTAVMAGLVVLYAKRRPKDESLTWGQAMASATYCTLGLFWAFGVVPHQWLTYAEGELKMRSDAILAGPGSTGLFKWVPVVISKQVVSDSVAVGLYGLFFGATIALWAVWQGRGSKTSEAVETSTYGRPLVKA
ncbi:MAG: hypothetical protein KDA95_05200 [Acidimicrobiales bacterium]|nr:hypothetical protein [Acidimicrobiales bacterium]